MKSQQSGKNRGGVRNGEEDQSRSGRERFIYGDKRWARLCLLLPKGIMIGDLGSEPCQVIWLGVSA